jgi:phosphatidylglycerophosphatase A
VKLWIAQGFGTGRVPFAPGTFGSIAGLIWFGLLVLSGHWWTFVAGMLLGCFASVWLCGYGERVLGQKDPGSVVLDEITAMPVCFASWIGVMAWNTGVFPQLSDFYSGLNWLGISGLFAAFRLFDIWKPWPVRQSQALPGGWGVTVDDFLAAIYVALAALPVVLWKHSTG